MGSGPFVPRHTVIVSVFDILYLIVKESYVNFKWSVKV
jgi:hypothetical protein